MLKSILSFFESDVGDEKSQHSVELATAALLFEVMQADDSIDEVERAVYRTHLKKHLVSVTDTELDLLLQDGEDHAKEAVDLVQFTSQLNAGFSPAKKIAILQSLWVVALADGVIDMHEEHIIRKISDLLYISHSDYIKAKLQAQDMVTK